MKEKINHGDNYIQVVIDIIMTISIVIKNVFRLTVQRFLFP